MIGLLEEGFAQLFEYEYTASMERDLDLISSGDKSRDEACASCANTVSRLVGEAGGTEKGGIQIDRAHHYIVGKHGPVIKHTDEQGVVSFKGVRSDIDLDRLKSGGYALDDLLLHQIGPRSLGVHEGQSVTLKVGRYGPYIEWNGARRSVPASAGAPGEITLERVLPLITNAGTGPIRPLDQCTSIRAGPHGDYVFHKKPGWKRPKFIPLTGFIKENGPNSYRDCPLELITTWLENRHGITCTAEGSGRGTAGGSRRGAGRARGSGRRGRRGN